MDCEVTIDIELKFYFDKAKATFDVLIDNMIKPDNLQSILSEFYLDMTISVVVKILLRVV